MANRKFLIDGIIGLAQKLGANPNKFMGTKSNINFLGTGDKGMKGTTFSGNINDDFLELGFTKNDLVKIIEQDAGYVTAGKLNDVQLNTMYNNLLKIDETFNPPPGPLNVIDLETGTEGLNKQGLESLRDTDKIKRFTQGLRTSKTAMTDKIKQGIEGLKTKLTGGADDVATKKASEADFTRMGAANFGDSVQAEGARRAVVRQLMKNNPDEFMLPPETLESISLSKDLGRGGSNFPDPLIVFRNIGNFTRQELDQIDEVIQRSPFDDIETISERVFDFIKKIRPEGFRPGFRSGKTVKGIAELLKLTNKKFGKDTLKVADDVEPSEFAKFNERNRKLTDDEYAELEEIYGEGLPQLETVADAEKFVAGQKAYEAAMFTDYKAGRLDPKPGESGRKKFLEKMKEEAEMSGDPKLFTRNEAEELASMKEYGGPRPDDYYRKSLEVEELVNADELPIELLNAEALMVKYPGMPERLAKLIGEDTNLQRKAEAIATIEQAMALKGAGKSSDELIEILKRESETKMAKGGLARILEM